jgi:ATP-dependent Clp protease ATP-binding subunit ClpC
MELFINGKLNPQAFDMDVRQGTRDLTGVLVAATHTQSPAVESTHFLIALAKVSGGITQKSLSRLGLTTEQWETGLAGCAARDSTALPLAHLTEDCLHQSARAMLKAAQTRCEGSRIYRIPEPILLLSGLENATSEVRSLFERADIDILGWREEIEKTLRPVKAVAVFKEDERKSLVMDSFSPRAERVLKLMLSEAESLGYDIADPRHLLLALVDYEGGATHYGIYCQGLLPNNIKKTVMLNLRAKARRTRSLIPPDGAHLQPVLQAILNVSGEMAGRDFAERIGEPHLLRAFLSVESMARRILEDEKVSISALQGVAESYDLGEEDEKEEQAIADIQVVQERLRERLVGQDGAIERILPYVQRMRFGFTVPGRPVGVFLFCGQSGSGKTEMAKELARAVYGSQENLIFLEMGQFNTPETMSIFVGAPPGYVGYGEGKLTNGLRDKPRAVVLFDEVEKAHAKVLDALLRFVDEGKIDDPAGPVRDGSQCILILTSNIGSEEIGKLWSEVKDNPNWRTIVREKLREEFRKSNFRPEFLNRVDELILFRTLTVADYSEIARRLLVRDTERLRKERMIEVVIDQSVTEAIGATCERISEGARAAQRLTQSVVITPVIDFVLRNSCVPPVRLRVKATGGSSGYDLEPRGIVELM